MASRSREDDWLQNVTQAALATPEDDYDDFGPDDGDLPNVGGHFRQRAPMHHQEATPPLGAAWVAPELAVLPLWKYHGLTQRVTRFRVQWQDPADAIWKDIGFVPAAIGPDAFVRKVGKPGTFRLHPLDNANGVVGEAVVEHIANDHEALQTPARGGVVGPGGTVMLGGGMDFSAMQGLMQTMMAPMMQQMQTMMSQVNTEKELLRQGYSDLREQSQRVAEQQQALITVANDSTTQAVMEVLRKDQERNDTMTTSMATIFAQMRASDAERSNSMLEQISTVMQHQIGAAEQSARDARAEAELRLERERDWYAARAKEQADWTQAMIGSEENKVKERIAMLERDAERTSKLHEALLHAKETQLVAQSPTGSLQQMIELKQQLEEAGIGGDKAERGWMGEVADLLKEGLKTAGEIGAARAKAAEAAAALAPDEGMEMMEDERDAIIRQQQHMIEMQQQASAVWGQQPESAPALALPGALPGAPPPPQQGRVDPFAAPGTPALPAPAQPQAQPQPQAHPAAGLPPGVQKNARAAFRWLADQFRTTPEDQWVSAVQGVLMQAWANVLPYAQAVSVRGALMEAGTSNEVAAKVASAVAAHPLTAQGLSTLVVGSDGALREAATAQPGDQPITVQQINW